MNMFETIIIMGSTFLWDSMLGFLLGFEPNFWDLGMGTPSGFLCLWNITMAIKTVKHRS